MLAESQQKVLAFIASKDRVTSVEIHATCGGTSRRTAAALAQRLAAKGLVHSYPKLGHMTHYSVSDAGRMMLEDTALPPQQIAPPAIEEKGSMATPRNNPPPREPYIPAPWVPARPGADNHKQHASRGF